MSKPNDLSRIATIANAIFNDIATNSTSITSISTGNLVVTGTATGVVVISDTAPANPANSQVWYSSNLGTSFVYYSSQWVETIDSQFSFTYPDMNGGTASTTNWTYQINCGGAT